MNKKVRLEPKKAVDKLIIKTEKDLVIKDKRYNCKKVNNMLRKLLKNTMFSEV